MLEKLILPKDIYDWAIEYLKRLIIKDKVSSEDQLRQLKRRLSKNQVSVDGLLLKAAETKWGLAERFLALAEQKQNEITALKGQITQLKAGHQEHSQQPIRIIELT